MIRNHFHRRNISSCEHKLGNIWLRMGYLSKSKLWNPENVENHDVNILGFLWRLQTELLFEVVIYFGGGGGGGSSF